MKYLLSVLLFLFSITFLDAQNEGNIWILGYSGGADCYKTGLDFNSGVLDTFSICAPVSFFLTNSSICDSNGDLLFYSNGYRIANGKHELVNGSAGFNPSATNPSQDYLNINQAVLSLPKPNSTSEFYIFHVNGESFTNNIEFQPFELRYSIIDMQADSGCGSIDSNALNVSFFQDTLILGRLTATKHANGIDWWLISHSYNSDEYLIFEVTSDSIIGPTRQRIGSFISRDIVGKACFSPSGNYFAQTGWDYFVDLIAFDRCTGTFHDWTKIEINDTSTVSPDTLLLISCEFSPNEHFLYANNNINLYQIDLTADTIQKSMSVVGTWDGLMSPQVTTFSQLQLANDNKIYLSTFQGTDRVHVIHNPNLKDTLVNFEQGLILPSTDAFVFPNLVNYDLDSLSTLFCDSIISLSEPESNHTSAAGLLVYPIPSTDFIYFKLKNAQIEIQNLEIISCSGQIVDSIDEVNSYQYLFNRNLPSGLYFYRILTKNQNLYTGKIIFE